MSSLEDSDFLEENEETQIKTAGPDKMVKTPDMPDDPPSNSSNNIRPGRQNARQSARQLNNQTTRRPRPSIKRSSILRETKVSAQRLSETRDQVVKELSRSREESLGSSQRATRPMSPRRPRENLNSDVRKELPPVPSNLLTPSSRQTRPSPKETEIEIIEIPDTATDTARQSHKHEVIELPNSSSKDAEAPEELPQVEENVSRRQGSSGNGLRTIFRGRDRSEKESEDRSPDKQGVSSSDIISRNSGLPRPAVNLNSPLRSVSVSETRAHPKSPRRHIASPNPAVESPQPPVQSPKPQSPHLQPQPHLQPSEPKVERPTAGRTERPPVISKNSVRNVQNGRSSVQRPNISIQRKERDIGIQEFVSPVRNDRPTPSPTRYNTESPQRERHERGARSENKYRGPASSVRQQRKEREANPELFKVANLDGNIPNYSMMPATNQAQMWTEFEIKFNIIRERYENYEISMPDRNNETLEEVHARYRQLVFHYHRQHFIDNTTNEYKCYLLILWVIIDLILGFLGLCAKGEYVKFQCRMTARYEHYLVMLGEDMWEAEGGGKMDPWTAMLKMNLWSSLAFVGAGIFAKFTGGGITIGADHIMDWAFGNKNGSEAEFSANVGGIDIGNAARAFTDNGGGLGGLMNGIGNIFSGMMGGGGGAAPPPQRQPSTSFAF